VGVGVAVARGIMTITVTACGGGWQRTFYCFASASTWQINPYKTLERHIKRPVRSMRHKQTAKAAVEITTTTAITSAAATTTSQI